MRKNMNQLFKVFKSGALTLLSISALIAPLEAQSGSRGRQDLIGHWRKTTIVFEAPQDANLVLSANGNFQYWEATARGRSKLSTGTWKVSGKNLVVRESNGSESSAPMFIHEGRLVFPNIPDRRQFWDRIQ